jgi:HK97 family phage portal protein
LRSRMIASLPLHLRNADKTPASDHPLYDLLHFSPNFDMTVYEFLQAMVACEDLWGNGFSRIYRNDARTRIVALEPFNTERMKVRRLDSGALEYAFQPAKGDLQKFNEGEVLHFRGFTLDGVVGLSPVEYFAETLGSQMAANRAAAREFSTGMKVGGFLKTPNGTVLDEPERKLMEQSLTRWNQPENMGKWFLLEGGVEPFPGEKLRMSPQVSQLLETRGFGIEEICRAYGTPPPLIGHTDKASSWASSLTSLNQFLLQYTIGPKLVAMEQRMAKQLLAAEERKQLFPRFNYAGLLRGDFAAQMTAFGQGLDRGIYNADDVRDFLDMPALPDGQGRAYRVPLNTAPAQSSTQQGDNRGAAAPAPPAPAPAPEPAKG